MLKHVFVLCVVVLVVGCHSSSSPVGSVMMQPVLELWQFAYDNSLVRPSAGVYPVYVSLEIANDPEASGWVDQAIVAANDLAASGSISFVRTMDPNAPISFRVDPDSPYAAKGVGWGYLIISADYRCMRDAIGFRSMAWARSNVAVHELGHFLFGPGHSPVAGDMMSLDRDYRNLMLFTSHEYQLWQDSLQFSPGTRLE